MSAAPFIALLDGWRGDPMHAIAALGVFAALVAIAFSIESMRETARRRSLADWAARRGFRLVVDAATAAPPQRWRFFNTGVRRKFASVVEGTAPEGGPRFRIFRYVFVDDSGRRAKWHQFVCGMTEEHAAASDGRVRVPDLQARPRRMIDSIGLGFGGGMKFAEDPAFGESYRVYADDEQAAAAFLDRELKAALLSDARTSWSGFGGGSVFVAIPHVGAPEVYDDAERLLLKLHQALVARLAR